MTPLPDVLTTQEVAALFRVHARTVARWAAAGKIITQPTPSGRNRYPASQPLIARMIEIASDSRGEKTDNGEAQEWDRSQE